MSLIKDTFHQVLRANFKKYIKISDNSNQPSPALRNIIFFQKENKWFYGIITDIEGHQLESLADGVRYIGLSLKQYI